MITDVRTYAHSRRARKQNAFGGRLTAGGCTKTINIWQCHFSGTTRETQTRRAEPSNVTFRSIQA